MAVFRTQTAVIANSVAVVIGVLSGTAVAEAPVYAAAVADTIAV